MTQCQKGQSQKQRRELATHVIVEELLPVLSVGKLLLTRQYQ